MSNTLLVTPKQSTTQKTVACHANTWCCGQTVFPVITKKEPVKAFHIHNNAEYDERGKQMHV